MRETLIFGSSGPLVCGRMTNAELSAPISGFFRAQNSGNTEGFLDLFTEDAVVSDESHSHRGEAIRTWMDAAIANFRPLHAEVVDVVSGDGSTVVTARVSGTFPGSPIQLRYRFTLRDGRIAAVTIAP